MPVGAGDDAPAAVRLRIDDLAEAVGGTRAEIRVALETLVFRGLETLEVTW